MADGNFLCYAEMDAFLRSLVVAKDALGRTGTVTWPSGREETVRIHSSGRISQLTPELVNGCKIVAWLSADFCDPARLQMHVTQPNGVVYGGMNSETRGVRTFINVDKEDTSASDLACCTDWEC